MPSSQRFCEVKYTYIYSSLFKSVPSPPQSVSPTPYPFSSSNISVSFPCFPNFPSYFSLQQLLSNPTHLSED